MMMIAVYGSMTMAAVAVDIQLWRGVGGGVLTKWPHREAFWGRSGCEGSSGAVTWGVTADPAEARAA